MDTNSVHEVAETLREAAESLDDPELFKVASEEKEVVVDTLDSREVLNFLKFFG